VPRSSLIAVAAIVIVIFVAGVYFLAGTPAANNSTQSSSSPSSTSIAPPSTSASTRTTSTTTIVKGNIRLGTFGSGSLPNLSNAGQSAEWLTSGLGYFQQAGVNVTIVPLQSSAVILQALQANQVDIADIGATEPVKLTALGQANFTAIMSVGASDCFTCTGGFFIATKNSIANINQLQGANIGISGAGGSDQVAAINVLKAMGASFNPSSAINWIAVNTPAARVAGLQQGSLDAVITSTQNMAAIQAMSNVHILVNSSTFLQYSPPAVPGLIVKTSFLAGNTALLQEFVTALIKGNRAFASNQTAWVSLAMKANSALNATAAATMYGGFAHGFSINGGINMTRAQLGMNYLYTTQEYITQSVPVITAQRFVNTTLVDNTLRVLGVSSAFDGIGRTVASATTTTAIVVQAVVPLQRLAQRSPLLRPAVR